MLKKYGVLLLAAALVLVSCATLQEKAERRALMKKAVAESLAKRQVHIDITSMSTMRYGTRTVTSDFFLEWHGDSLRSYLPYLGQAHQAPMMLPSQGLDFDEPVQELKESHPKEGLTRLEMVVRTREDRYLYAIELHESGKAYIHVQSQHRDPISFDGDFSSTSTFFSEFPVFKGVSEDGRYH